MPYCHKDGVGKMTHNSNESGCPAPQNAPSNPQGAKAGQGVVGGTVLAADDRGLVIKAPDGRIWVAEAYCGCNSGSWWVSVLPADSPNLTYAARELLREVLG